MISIYFLIFFFLKKKKKKKNTYIYKLFNFLLKIKNKNLIDLQKSTFLSANSSAADMVKRKRTFAQREGEIYDKH